MLVNLKKLREEASVSQKALAEAVGVSQQSINKYENHNIEPDIETLIRISDYFDTSVDYLVGNTNLKRKITEYQAFDLTSEESYIVEKYRALKIKQKACIRQLIDSYFD